MDYLAYTAKVGDLANRYSWISVMLYDNEYRGLQAAYNFRWGSDIPHLTTVCLKERQPSPKQSVKSPPGNKPLSKGKEICRQFNRGSCSFGSKCIFSHVCFICKGQHPVGDHDKLSSDTGGKDAAK